MNHFPVLLADLEGLMGVLFFVIAFIGWVMNLSKENKQVQQRKNRGQQPGKQKGIQNEIDQFLQETRKGERRKPRQQPKPSEVMLSDDEIEIIEEAPRQRRPPQQRRRKRVTQEQPAPRPTPAPQNKPATRQKSPSRKPLKSSINEHVQQALPHSVDQNVATHLGTFTAASATSAGQRAMAVTTRNRKTPAVALITMMRSQTRVRDAIMINEVLNRPKSLQRKSDS